MVLSLKANRKRILAVIIIIAIVVGGFIIIPKLVTEPIKHYGETAAQRTEFLKSFGYEVSEEPIDSRNVIIPKEFNDVYMKYNIMQKAQGFDLKPYSGKECTQYVYLIKNYPGSDKEIHATMLVYEGVIIGGDVACAEVGGFMHGFAADSARYGENDVQSSKADSSVAESSAPQSAASSGAEQTNTDVTEEDSTTDVSADETDTEETATDEAATEETAADETTTDEIDNGAFPVD